MPNRILRESILDSEAVNSLSPEAEVFYRRLMSVVDDFGRFDARPAVLRSRLYPLQLERVREANVVRCLAECEAANLVRLYTANGGQYLTFPKLGVPRANSSKYPDPPNEGEKLDVSADARTCAQTRADVPDSYSGSNPNAHSDSEIPPTPRRGERRRKPAEKLPEIPEPLDTSEFRQAWEDWLQHRREKRQRVTPKSAELAFREMAQWGPERAVAAIRHSIARGWQGIFEPAAPAARAGPTGKPTTYSEWKRQRGG